MIGLLVADSKRKCLIRLSVRISHRAHPQNNQEKVNFPTRI
jgi:hypothetical protein